MLSRTGRLALVEPACRRTGPVALGTRTPPSPACLARWCGRPVTWGRPAPSRPRPSGTPWRPRRACSSSASSSPAPPCESTGRGRFFIDLSMVLHTGTPAPSWPWPIPRAACGRPRVAEPPFMRSDDPLDRGWQFLDDGDLAGARRAARQALRVAPGSPEALLLQAACERAGERLAEAEQLLRRVAQTDREWATPVLWLAEILAGDTERQTEALRHARRAVEFAADDQEEWLRSTLLVARISLDGDNDEAARDALRGVPSAEGDRGPRGGAGGRRSLPGPRRRRAGPRPLRGRHARASRAGRRLARPRAGRAGTGRRSERGRGLGRGPPPGRGGAPSTRKWPGCPRTSSSRWPRRRWRSYRSGRRRFCATCRSSSRTYPSEEDMRQGLDPRLLGVFSGLAYGDRLGAGRGRRRSPRSCSSDGTWGGWRGTWTSFGRRSGSRCCTRPATSSASRRTTCTRWGSADPLGHRSHSSSAVTPFIVTTPAG